MELFLVLFPSDESKIELDDKSKNINLHNFLMINSVGVNLALYKEENIKSDTRQKRDENVKSENEQKINGKNFLHKPSFRKLRAFAFDPILSRRVETYDINEVKIKLPWEDNLGIGPVDDYLEVVDYDPASKGFYAPVDLNEKYLLAQDGLGPSEGTPQFHQQMVYAVARTTICHFEKALGRRALWSSRFIWKNNKLIEEFIERLRIYPHALREANAYYSPVKKALLFGYFPASTVNPGENLPGGTVFTCISHDIVAHETTHALLDGLHRRFIEPTSADVWALHEAFADIVALFQHFTYPEVLRHQISKTRGELEKQNLLGGLAYQFGQAIERYGALRSAIGKIDEETKQWVPLKADPEEILKTWEPHRRGAILVAAVFSAFLTIYKSRIADLVRIATSGSGILPTGQISVDLVNRMAREAAKSANHILNICIRALDYCPPVDVNFGDYLRAIITADSEIVSDDPHNYRLAVIDAFRERGIYPNDVRNLSEESLLWHTPDEEEQRAFKKVFSSPSKVRQLIPDWRLNTPRRKIFKQAKNSREKLHSWFINPKAKEAAEACKIVLDKKGLGSIYQKKDFPALEVHSVRPTCRIGPDNQTITELVIEMTQRRRGYLDIEIQNEVDQGNIKPPKPDFIFRGGCTLLLDLEKAEVKYCIYKRVSSDNRLNRVRKYLLGEAEQASRDSYFGDSSRAYWRDMTSSKKDVKLGIEPFALLHRSFEGQEEN